MNRWDYASVAMGALAMGVAMIATAKPSGLYALDGDTVASGTERWRISNIDAPEMRGKCDAEVRLAHVAKARLQALLDSGQVSVERHGTDQYGRALVRLYVAGTDLGDQLVAEELARPWTGHREPWCEQ